MRAFVADDAIPRVRFRVESAARSCRHARREIATPRSSRKIEPRLSTPVSRTVPQGAKPTARRTARARSRGRAADRRAALATPSSQRKPDDDVIEALKATGVFRSFVPRRFGGYEIDLDLFVDIGVAVSEACPSTGWITTFYMEHNWLLGFFAPSCSRRCSRDEPYMLAPGSVNPKDGQATPKGDGYELTGHWQFATGIVHADWVLLSAHGSRRARRRCSGCFWCARPTSRCATPGTSTAWSRRAAATSSRTRVFVPERHDVAAGAARRHCRREATT